MDVVLFGKTVEYSGFSGFRVFLSRFFLSGFFLVVFLGLFFPLFLSIPSASNAVVNCADWSSDHFLTDPVFAMATPTGDIAKL